MNCRRWIVFSEQKSRAEPHSRQGGRTVSLLQSLLYRHCFSFSVLCWIIASYTPGSIRCCYSYHAVTMLPCIVQCLTVSWCLGEITPTGGGVALQGGCLGSEFLNAWLLWSSTKHAGPALRGLWIFHISSTLSVWMQSIPFITSSCTQTVMIHFPLRASRWLSQVRFLPLIFFQYKDVTVYFRH